MTTPPDAGQASPPPSMSAAQALSLLARAAHDLRATGVVEVGPLLAAYRALEPISHPGCLGLAPDVGFVAAAAAFGPPLLDADEIAVATSVPRAPPVVSRGDGESARICSAPGPEATADALTLALGLALEAAKLTALHDEEPEAGRALDLAARALATTPAEIAQTMGCDIDAAATTLDAVLQGGAVRRVHAPLAARAPLPVDEVVLDVASDDDGPLFVLAGATERLQDLLSPWVRRLEPSLARLAASRGADDLYAALPLLVAEEPRCHDERLDVEAREGFTPCGGALVVRFDRVDPARADERARPLLRGLKQSRARAVLCDRHPETLAAVLARVGKRARVVAVLAEAIGGRSPYPDVVVDALSGHPLDLDNALAEGDDDSERAVVCVSPPSLGLSPRSFVERDVSCAPLLAPLLLEAVHARAGGLLSRRSRLAAATFAPGDSAAASAVSLRCLARMAGTAPLPRRQQRRPPG